MATREAMMTRVLVLVVAVVAGLIASPGMADDWVAAKVRGLVFVNDLAAGNRWVPLARGASVTSTQVVRTMQSGRVEFTRGSEIVDFGANTQARIEDRGAARFTTVHQDFGTVAVEADVLKVKHFAVETPYLVAAVKGTRYTVVTRDRQSWVKVVRGLVGVTGKGSGQAIVVPAGQQVVANASGPMVVSGRANGNVEDGEDAGLGSGKGVVKGVVHGVGSSVGGVGRTVGNTVSSTAGAVGHTVSDTVGAVGNTVSGTVGAVGSTASDVAHTTGDLVGSTVGGLTHTLSGLLGH